MKIQLSKSVMTAFGFAQTAISRVVDDKNFRWEQMDIKLFDMSDQFSEEEKNFHFTGSILTSDRQFSVLSSVWIIKNWDGEWQLDNVDVYCHPPNAVKFDKGHGVYQFVEGIEPYTYFKEREGELVEVE